MQSPPRPRSSWLRRVGLALLAILWMAWFVMGAIAELAGSLAMGDHSEPSYATATMLLTVAWIVPLVVIGALIYWIRSRPRPRQAREAGRSPAAS